MEKVYKKISSEYLNKDMNVAVYGHYGFGLLFFPSFTDDFMEIEENGLINSIKNHIDKGKCRVFSIEGIMSESWGSSDSPPERKSQRHLDYNNFLTDEAVPFIYNQSGGPVPIICAGASIGAYNAVNTYFRRPDIFYGAVGMSGHFNIEQYTSGYFDDNCYFNSPVHYLPNLTEDYWLSFLTGRHHVYLLSGSGDGENPGNTLHLHEILKKKNIHHFIDIWGKEWRHDWHTWQEMLAKIIGEKF